MDVAEIQLSSITHPNVKIPITLIPGDTPVMLGRNDLDLFPELHAEKKKISRQQIQLFLSQAEDNAQPVLFATRIGANSSTLNDHLMDKDKPYVIHYGDRLTLGIIQSENSELRDLFPFLIQMQTTAAAPLLSIESNFNQTKETTKKLVRKKSAEKLSGSSGYFAEFVQLCQKIKSESGHQMKAAIITKFLTSFTGDLYLLYKLLLIRSDLRTFNIKEKQFARLFVKFLNTAEIGVDQIYRKNDSTGNPGETAQYFMEKYNKTAKRSSLTLFEIDQFLTDISNVSKDQDQFELLNSVLAKCTSSEVDFLWRLLDKDLKINIGPKFALDALHKKAFAAYKTCENLKLIIERIQAKGNFSDLTKASAKTKGEDKPLKRADSFGVSIIVGQPIRPMLARQSGNAKEIMGKCLKGAYVEIKYDGERIQIHKQNNQFNFFSRNLKISQEWKVRPVKDSILKATKAESIILDGEILLIDTETKRPLPFGTFAKHKKEEHSHGQTCVFLFDILYLNGESLIHLPISERRQKLAENIEVIENQVELSESTFMNDPVMLDEKLKVVMKQGLEGLVVKDVTLPYEPNMRHWFKVKKDYLKGQSDSADLIVLGANFGTGRLAGLMSVFVMGVFDSVDQKFKTVCRVGNGFTDDGLKQLQNELKMIQISHDRTKVPSWLSIHREFVPDFVVKDPKKSPIWEIEGAEFTYSPKHTANAVSIRFPRILKVRDDKDFKTATTLQELMELVKESEKVKPLLFRPAEEFVKKREEIDSNTIVHLLNSYEDEEGDLDQNDASPQREMISKKMKIETGEEFSKPNAIVRPAQKQEWQEEDMLVETAKKRNIKKPPIEPQKIGPPKKKCAPQVRVFRKLDSHTTEIRMNLEAFENHNEKITKIFEEMGNYEKHMGNGIKHKAYMKAATALQFFPQTVTSGKEVKHLDGIGKGMMEKIDEILKTGKLSKLEEAKADPKIQAVARLCQVSGIGPHLAHDFVHTDGVRSVEDLWKIKSKLNNNQLIGLRYFYEFQERIPREEVSQVVKKVEKIARAIDPKLSVTCCGSYRRMKPTCGDIDILLSHPDWNSWDEKTPSFLNDVIQNMYEDVSDEIRITDHISWGTKNYHGVVTVADSRHSSRKNINNNNNNNLCEGDEEEEPKHRRLDLMWIPNDSLPFAVLYFTGSGFFNIQMRRIALERGFTLNEEGIFPIGETGLPGDAIEGLQSERDIFDFLGMTWREPPERDLAPSWKPTMS